MLNWSHKLFEANIQSPFHRSVFYFIFLTKKDEPTESWRVRSVSCDWNLFLSQTAHRGVSAKPESLPDASNPASAPTSSSTPSGSKSKPSGKPDTSDGEDWGREQEEEEDDEEEENDEDDEGDEDYEAPGGNSAAGGGGHSSAPTEWTCAQCQTTFTNNDDYQSHVKTEHGKVQPLPHIRLCSMNQMWIIHRNDQLFLLILNVLLFFFFLQSSRVVSVEAPSALPPACDVMSVSFMKATRESSTASESPQLSYFILFSMNTHICYFKLFPLELV